MTGRAASSGISTKVWIDLHRALLVSERDAHFFECDLVQRPRHLKTLGLLILLQAGARGRVELARLIAAIEVPLLQNRLSLFDFISIGSKDRPPVCIRARFVGIGLLADCAAVAVLGENDYRE